MIFSSAANPLPGHLQTCWVIQKAHSLKRLHPLKRLWGNEGEDASLLFYSIQNLFKLKWKLLFCSFCFFFLIGTCSHFHWAGPEFSALNKENCNDNSFFEQDIWYWPQQWWIRLSNKHTHNFLPQYRRNQLQQGVGSLCQKLNWKEIYTISMFTNTWNTQNQDGSHHYQKMTFTLNYFHASEGLSIKPVIAEFFMVGSICICPLCLCNKPR